MDGTMEGDALAPHVASERQLLPDDFISALAAKVVAATAVSPGSPSIIDALVPLDAIAKSLEAGAPALPHSPQAARDVWRVVAGPGATTPTPTEAEATDGLLLPWLRALATHLCTTKSPEGSKVLLEALRLSALLPGGTLRHGATAAQLIAVRGAAWHVLNCFHLMRAAFAAQAEALVVLDAVLGHGAGVVLTAAQFDAAAVAALCIEVGSADSKEGAGAKSAALQLLGHLCRAYEVAVAAVPGLGAAALGCFMKVAGRLTDSARAPQELGKGFFRGLTDLLTSHPLRYGDPVERRQLVLLGQLCLGALRVALEAQAYAFTLAALWFLQHHAAGDLAEPLYANAPAFLEVLRRLWSHRNALVHRAAYPATAAFLRAVAERLVEHQAEPAALELLAALLAGVTDTLRSPDSTPGEVSLALVALGAMARPIRCLDSPEALLQVFRLLLKKTQVILPAPANNNSSGEAAGLDGLADRSEWHSDVVRLLPNFFAAFASFVGELPVMPAAGVATVERLLEVALARYPTPAFFPRLKAVTVPAVLRLLGAMFWLQCRERSAAARGEAVADDGGLPASAGLDGVCAAIAERTLQLALAAKVSGAWGHDEDEEDGAATEGDDDNDAVAGEGTPSPSPAKRPYTSPQVVVVYTELWRALLSPAAADTAKAELARQLAGDRLDGGAVASECVEAALARLRAALQSLAQQLLSAWDLAVVDHGTGRPVSLNALMLRHNSNTDAAVELPRAPEDYRCFLLLVPLYTTLAPALWRPIRHWAAAGADEEEGAAAVLRASLDDWLLALVALSVRFPHASGLFRLLSSTLRAAACWTGAGPTAAVVAVRAHVRSCRQRMRSYADELLYQCAVFVLAASCGEEEEGEGGEGLPHPLLHPLRVVLSARNAAAEDEDAARAVADNRRAALQVLRSRLHANPACAAALLPPLVATPELAESPEARQGLGELAAEYGLLVAAALKQQEGQGGGTDPAEAVPMWRLKADRLTVPMPAQSTADLPVGRLVGPVAHLCLHGATRRERTTACELFHFLVTWLVGRGASGWYGAVLPAVARLAAGGEEEGMSAALFHDLLLQIARWLASAPAAAVPQPDRDRLERVLLAQLGHDEAALRRTAAEALCEYAQWIGGSGSGSSGSRLEAEQQQRAERLAQKLQAALMAERAFTRLGATGLLRRLLHSGGGPSVAWLVHRNLARWLRALVGSLEADVAATAHAESVGVVEEVVECLRLMPALLVAERSKDTDTHADTELPRRVARLMVAAGGAALGGSLDSDSTRRPLLDALADVLASLCQGAAGGSGGGKAVGEFVTANTDLFTGSADASPAAVAGAALALLTLVGKVAADDGGSGSSSGGGHARRKGKSDKVAPGAQGHAETVFIPVITAVLSSGNGASAHVADLSTALPGGSAAALLMSVLAEVLGLFTGAGKAEEGLRLCGGAALGRLAASAAVERRSNAAADAGAPPPLLAAVCAALGEAPRSAAARAMVPVLLGSLRDCLPALFTVADPSPSPSSSSLFTSVRTTVEAAAGLLRLEPAGESDAPNLWVQLLLSLPLAANAAVSGRLLAVVGAAARSDLVALHSAGPHLCLSAATLLLAGGQMTAGGVVEAVTAGSSSGDGATAAVDSRALSADSDGLSLASDRHAQPPDAARLAGALGAALRQSIDLAHGPEAKAELLVAAAEDLAARLCSLYRSDAEGDDSSGGGGALGHLRRGVDAALLLRVLALLKGAAGRRSWALRGHLSACVASLLSMDEMAASAEGLALQLRVVTLAAAADVEALLLSAAALAARTSAGFSPNAFGGRPRTLLASGAATERFLLASRACCAVLNAAAARPLPAAAALADSCVAVLRRVVSDELPLRWSELGANTTEAANYRRVVASLVALAAAVSRLRPPVLFELLPVLSQTDLPGGERLGAAVEAAFAGLSVARLEELCGECAALQGGGLPRDVWWTATHRIFLPALRTFPAAAQAAFFERHMQAWVQTAVAPSVSAGQRSNAFVLLEAMYRLADAAALKGPINDAYTGTAGTGTELTKALIKATAAARKFVGGGDEEALGLRQAAHRCLMAVLVATQREEAVFRKLLLDPGTVDWNLLTDGDGAWGPLPEAVDFPRVPEAVAKGCSDWELRVRPFARLADSATAESAADPLLASQGGGGDWLLLSQPATSAATSAVFYDASRGLWSQRALAPADGNGGDLVDLDSVWQCTCTGALLSLVDFLIERFPHSGGWVADLHRLLADTTVSLRLRLVVARLVQLRAKSFFHQHAALLAPALVAASTDPALGPALHYIARDAVFAIVDWVRAGHYEPDAGTARALLTFVVRAAPLTAATYYARCNVELFRELCELLPADTPQCLPASALTAALASAGGGGEAAARSGVGVQLCGVVADRGVALASLAAVPSEATALHAALVELLAHGAEAVAVAAAEVLAMEVRLLRANASRGGAADRLEAAIVRQVQAQWSQSPQRRALTLRAVRVMEACCPAAAAALLPSAIFHGYVALGAPSQLLVLDVLGAAPQLAAETPYFETLHSHFAGGLDRYAAAVGGGLYSLLALIAPHLPADNLATIAGAFLTERALAAVAASADGRVAFFRLATRLQALAPTEAVRRLLLARGLADPAPFVQDVVLEYLDASLAAAGEDGARTRAAAVLRSLAAADPRRWLQHAAVLLLAPSRRTREFTDTAYYFPRPLKNCAFAPRPPTATIGGGGGGTAVSRQLPLFSLALGAATAAGTVAPRPMVTFTRASQQLTSACGASSRQPSHHPSALAASLRYSHLSSRQGRAVPSSVAPATATALFTTFNGFVDGPAGVHSGLLFARRDDLAAAEAGGLALPPPPRRLVTLSESAAATRFMHKSHQLRQARLARARVLAVQRSQELIAYRAYRDGDVPDVQASAESLVTPLQALCLGNEAIAAVVCACLVEGAAAETGGTTPQPPAAAAAKGASKQQEVPFFARAGAGGDASSFSPAQVRGALASFLGNATAAEADPADASYSPLLARFELEMALLVEGRPGPSPHQTSSSSSSPSALAGATVELWHTEIASAKRPTAAQWLRGCDALLQTGARDASVVAARRALSPQEARQLSVAMEAQADGAQEAAEQRLAALLEAQAGTDKDEDSGKQALFLRLRRDAAAALLRWDSVADSFPDSSSSDLGLYAALRARPAETAAALVASPTAARQSPLIRGLSLFLSCGGSSGQPTTAALDRLSRCVEVTSAAIPELVFAGRDCEAAHRVWLVLEAARLVQGASLHPEAAAVAAAAGAYFSGRPQHPPRGNAAGRVAALDDALALRHAVWRQLSALRTATAAEGGEEEEEWGRRAAGCAASLLTVCRDGCAGLVGSRLANGAAHVLMERLGAAEGSAAVALARKALWVPLARGQLYRAVFAAPYDPTCPTIANLRTVTDRLRTTVGLVGERDGPALAADAAVCELAVLLRGRPGATSTSVLMGLAGSLRDALGELSGLSPSDRATVMSNDVVLLDALDGILSAAMLSGQSKSLSTNATLIDDDDLNDGKSYSATAEASLETCWVLYAGTMIRALARGGAGASAALLLERVPRLLQIFELRGVCGGAARWGDTLAALQALPPAVWRPWLPPLINWLLRSRHGVLAAVLAATARAHPQLAYYPLNCAAGELGRLQGAALPALDGLLEFMRAAPELAPVRAFAAAVHRLQDPRPRLQTALKHVFVDLRRAATPGSAADRAFYLQRAQGRFDGATSAAGYEDSEDAHMPFVGTVAMDLRPHFLDGQGRLAPDPEAFKRAYNERYSRNVTLQAGGRADRPHTRLASFSQWLASLGSSAASGAVMVPCQPATLLHTAVGPPERIIAVNPDVTVMSSLQKPVRLRLLTTEGERDFLAKGGDDLRLDQRVEELFVLCNGYLRRHDSERRHDRDALRIRHYSVVPVSLEVGLVEWVPGTVVLQGVLEDSLGGALWGRPELGKYGGEYRGLDDYAESFTSKQPEEVARWYGGLVKSIPSTLLTDGILAMAPDRCGWHNARGAFLRTTAAFSMASYLFGVGDRHLSNCLIDARRGDAISIDFGRTFGSATEALRVPELIPFRLTPQLQAVQGPLGNELTSLLMQRAMAAFRRHRSVIEGLATAFVYEPIVDWEYESVTETGAEVAEDKAMSVYRKLALESPCELLKEHVRLNKNRAVKAALKGIERTVDRHRPTFADAVDGDEEAVAVEEGNGSGNGRGDAEQIRAFVQCLVGLATDPSILGRTYAGWMPLF